MVRRTRRGPYVVCVSNRGYRASLVVRKIYRTLPDARGERLGLVRVVDESGEDYLYPERMFVAIEVPRGAARVFRASS